MKPQYAAQLSMRTSKCDLSCFKPRTLIKQKRFKKMKDYHIMYWILAPHSTQTPKVISDNLFSKEKPSSR